jgi:hypothetical protein
MRVPVQRYEPLLVKIDKLPTPANGEVVVFRSIRCAGESVGFPFWVACHDHRVERTVVHACQRREHTPRLQTFAKKDPPKAIAFSHGSSSLAKRSQL